MLCQQLVETLPVQVSYIELSSCLDATMHYALCTMQYSLLDALIFHYVFSRWCSRQCLYKPWEKVCFCWDEICGGGQQCHGLRWHYLWGNRPSSFGITLYSEGFWITCKDRMWKVDLLTFGNWFYTLYISLRHVFGWLLWLCFFCVGSFFLLAPFSM